MDRAFLSTSVPSRTTLAAVSLPIPTVVMSSASSPPPPPRRAGRANSMQPTSERAPLSGYYRSSIMGASTTSSSATATALLLFGTDRNSEESHAEALAAAQAEHERVRMAAIQAFEMHELRMEAQRLQEEQLKQEERIRAEQKLVEEQKRLQQLQATQVERPVATAPAKAQIQAQAPAQAPALAQAQAPAQPSPFSSTLKGPFPASSQPAQQAQPKVSALSGLLNPAPSSAAAAAPAAPAAATLSKATPAQPPAAPKQPQPTAQQPQSMVAPSTAGLVDRYVEIHRNLKTLRQQLTQATKQPGSVLYDRFGEMRRIVRRSVGQLTTNKASNSQTTNRVTELLLSAVDGTVPSPPVAVASYLLEPRAPLPTHALTATSLNDDMLPSLFLYLINVFAKSIIRQFTDECGANPAAAEPIGVATATVFSNVHFQWRGASLIDILMAKFRISCPVLFGLRGRDTTEQGRARVGWRREGGAWITEQMHSDRMTGLGAGFAAVSLRNFSRATRANPYPPHNYWRALAAILNTPDNQVSATQIVVLKAMIDGYEGRFLEFYGTAGLAALRIALVEFPKRAPPNAATQAMTLSVLGDVLQRDRGLLLTG